MKRITRYLVLVGAGVAAVGTVMADRLPPLVRPGSGDEQRMVYEMQRQAQRNGVAGPGDMTAAQRIEYLAGQVADLQKEVDEQRAVINRLASRVGIAGVRPRPTTAAAPVLAPVKSVGTSPVAPLQR